MQAAYILPSGNITFVNFAQAARVRAHDSAWSNLLALDDGTAVQQVDFAAAARLEIALGDGHPRGARGADVIYAFGSEAPCAALQAAARRAAQESLL